MANERLVNDHAFSGSKCLLEALPRDLSPEQREAFFHTAFKVCKALIESYLLHREREQSRLSPGNN